MRLVSAFQTVLYISTQLEMISDATEGTMIHRVPRLLILATLAVATAGCIPVSDPGRWDPTAYCATVRPPDPWCHAHGY
jgi:hypothetical protein